MLAKHHRHSLLMRQLKCRFNMLEPSVLIERTRKMVGDIAKISKRMPRPPSNSPKGERRR
jgi:hypothetical protein